MRRVIDCSTAFKWAVAETDSGKAIGLRDDHRAGIGGLMAPDIFVAEMASSLLTAQRKGRISDFAAPLYGILSEGIDLHDATALMPRVARIVASITSGMRFSIYDCLYVALAEREGCELITSDQRLVNVFAQAYPFITPLSSL